MGAASGTPDSADGGTTGRCRVPVVHEAELAVLDAVTPGIDGSVVYTRLMRQLLEAR